MLIAGAWQSQPTRRNVLFVRNQSIHSTYTSVVDRYLERIKVRRTDISPDLVTLNLLQKQHLLNVPFENLDIHWKRPILLSTAAFYGKIVGERRGGFCYELNGLFDELLRYVGFKTRLISARVFHDDGTTGPEFDHAAIIVSLNEGEYLTDVGFGDFTAGPLQLMIDQEQFDETGTFSIRRNVDGDFEVLKRMGDDWKGEYAFRDIPRDLSEFSDMCDFQQYSPNSHFTRGKICSVLTENGRKTLTDTKFIVNVSGDRTETAVASDSEFDEILMREFQIGRLTQHL